MKVLIFTFFVCGFSACYAQLPDSVLQNVVPPHTNILQKLCKNDGITKINGIVSAVINKFVDEVNQRIDAYCVKHGLDSINITDIDEKFDGGDLKLSNATLNGLSTINRTGDATVSYSSAEDKFQVQIPIDLIKIYFLSHFHVKILFVGAQGKVRGTVKHFQSTINVSFDIKNANATVDSISTKGMGPITVTFDGSGILPKIATLVSRFVSEILQPRLDKLVKQILYEVSNMIVDTINKDISQFLHPNNTITTY